MTAPHPFAGNPDPAPAFLMTHSEREDLIANAYTVCTGIRPPSPRADGICDNREFARYMRWRQMNAACIAGMLHAFNGLLMVREDDQCAG